MSDVTSSDLFAFSEIAVMTNGGIVALESTANIVGIICHDSLSVHAGA